MARFRHMHNMGIYKITSKIKGDFYIGSAVNLTGRKNKHYNMLKLKTHHNVKLQNHSNKYGVEDLVFSVLENINDEKLLISREQFYIDNFNPVFNICKKAGSRLGVKITEETRAKIIGRPAWNKGKKTPKSIREKQSKTHKKRTYGKKSEETRVKIAKGSIGNKNASGKRTEEQRNKMRLAHLGKKVSEETKSKMRESQRRRFGNGEI